MIEEIFFNNSRKKIEGVYFQSTNINNSAAIIISPHPLYGGTMNNTVIHNIFYVLVKNNFSVLKFNFRGVGKSMGYFDHGNGELMDAAIAFDWLRNKNPEARDYWVIGFSFGAWLALQLLLRRPEINYFIMIAPTTASYDFNFVFPCPASGIIIQGNRDVISKQEDSYKLYQKLSRENMNVYYKLIVGADHSFFNCYFLLNYAIQNFIIDRKNSEADDGN